MECDIVWTASAQRGLQGIHSYISQFRPLSADRVIQRILKRVERLRKTPFLGSLYENDPSQRYREVFSGKYRIFYRVDESAQKVYVVAVRHSARQEPELPLE